MDLRGFSPFTGKPLQLITSGSRIAGSKIPDTLPQDAGYLCPGFIDLQVNGCLGADYSAENFEADQVEVIVRKLASAGTTRHLPTMISSSQERILRNLEIIRRVRDNDELLEAAIPGVHIEGPYISELDGFRGVHDSRYIRNPEISEYREWQDASGHLVSLVTLAPERRGAIEFIEEVVSDGVVVALGHTAASGEIIRRAVSAGARLSTHLGNGCPSEIPRLNNFLWPQLAADELYASLIVDGYHLPPEVVETFSRAKKRNRLVLVSDAAPASGYPKGRYYWGQIEIEVFEDGHLGIPGGKILAGAAFFLDWNLAHYMKYRECGLGDALPLCTVNPARLMGLEHSAADPGVGDAAHLVLVGRDDPWPRLRVLKTVTGGKTTFEAERD
jgi:N-acetylglucosamine-6-phosphate deacetylase